VRLSSVQASTATAPSPDELLRAALDGDQARFGLLVAPHVRELHVHCYRMLGSFHDAEDATQETLLRAWRHLDTFQGRGPLRAWLYRIATTTCLKQLESRRRGRLAARPEGAEVPWLEPYPDRLLDELPHDGPDPAAVAEQRESVALAFVVALQQLTARQRAVLVLREVVGWSAAEVAGLLETSVPAVNSALQRARATLGQAGPTAGMSARSLPAQEQDVLRRFMLAWQRRDLAGLAALLAEDAVLEMPPQSLRYLGREQVARFFVPCPPTGGWTAFGWWPRAPTGSRRWPPTCPPPTAPVAPTASWCWSWSRTGSRPSSASRTPRCSRPLACLRPAPEAWRRHLSPAGWNVGSALLNEGLEVAEHDRQHARHSRLTSASAAGSRARKLDSHTIVVPRGVGSTAKRPWLSATGRPPSMV
jgi:RNA polymerase sigma-70 factor, ECF subfamily